MPVNGKRIEESVNTEPLVYYIITEIWSAQVAYTYGFRSDMCSRELIQELESAHDNCTCPPIWDEEASDEEQNRIISMEGTVLEYGCVNLIQDLERGPDFSTDGCIKTKMFTFYLAKYI